MSKRADDQEIFVGPDYIRTEEVQRALHARGLLTAEQIVKRAEKKELDGMAQRELKASRDFLLLAGLLFLVCAGVLGWYLWPVLEAWLR